MAVLKRVGQEFAAEIGQFTVSMKDVTKRYFHESVILLCEIMQTPKSRGGRMPVLYGFLRSTLMVSTSPIALGTMKRPVDEPIYLYFPNRTEDEIRKARPGQTLYIGYGAEYADAQEYGWDGHPGNAFQRMAVQQWPMILAATEQRLMRGYRF